MMLSMVLQLVMLMIVADDDDNACAVCNDVQHEDIAMQIERLMFLSVLIVLL